MPVENHLCCYGNNNSKEELLIHAIVFFSKIISPILGLNCVTICIHATSGLFKIISHVDILFKCLFIKLIFFQLFPITIFKSQTPVTMVTLGYYSCI